MVLRSCGHCIFFRSGRENLKHFPHFQSKRPFFALHGYMFEIGKKLSNLEDVGVKNLGKKRF